MASLRVFTHLIALISCCPALLAAAPDRVLFDFESGAFSGWEQVGEEAFGTRPVEPLAEMLHTQAPHGPYRFSGWEGRYMLSHNITLSKRFGTRVTQVPNGRLVSEPFTIDRDYLTFKLGGTLHPGVSIALVLEPEKKPTGESELVPVRRTYANNKFDLVLRGWDVKPFRGQRARVVVFGEAGHRVMLRLDQFVLTDTPVPNDVLYGRTHWLDSTRLAPGKFHLMFNATRAVPALWHASLVRGHDGRWHLFAEESKHPNGYSGDVNNLIYHASAADLHGTWSELTPVLFRDRARGESWLRDPTVVFDEKSKLYVMTYWGSGKSATEGPFGIHLATSRDGQTWERDPRNPIFTHEFTPANGSIVRDGSRWVMLYSNLGDEAVHVDRARLFARTSENLRDWSAPRELEITSARGQDLGHVRPIAFKRGDEWFLLTNNRTSQQGRTRFLFTQVYTSRDLFKWDIEKDYRGNLNVWGGPPVIQDSRGDWHIVHCHVTSGGPWVARLRFNDSPQGEFPVAWPGVPVAIKGE
jgi:hypothetical protein